MIEELRRTIEHLEHEDNKKTEERHKYARDIEQVKHTQCANKNKNISHTHTTYTNTNKNTKRNTNKNRNTNTNMKTDKSTSSNIEQVDYKVILLTLNSRWNLFSGGGAFQVGDKRLLDHHQTFTGDKALKVSIMLETFQEENRKLSSSLTAATERDSGVSEDESYIEIDLVHKLQVGFLHFSY